MTSSNQNTMESVTINWCIDNFQFCWHETGEKLESPLFHIDFLIQTSWRLWFYPRGEDDAEYVSFYLFREEGGPEVVDIDFQLFKTNVCPGEIILNWYSFKIHQREGFKCFVPRCKVFYSMADKQRIIRLNLGCRIFNRKGQNGCSSVQHLYTMIGMESIQGVEIFDSITDINSPSSRDIDIISLLEDNPLINISLSCNGNSLVIKILPVNCKKIKYALCRITIIKSWKKESSIEHVRSWIGEMKADIWRYRVFFPGTKTFTTTALFVKYDFKFSTGKMMESCELRDSTYDSFRSYLCIKPAKSAPTALDALKESYISKSFVDVTIKAGTKTYSAHKAILSVRSAGFRSYFEKNSGNLKLSSSRFDQVYEDFFFFFYTDTSKLLNSEHIYNLYFLSTNIDFKSLNIFCKKFNLYKLDTENAFSMLHRYNTFQGSDMLSTLENFIAAHYDIVMRGINWEKLVCRPDIRKQLLFSKYKRRKTTTCCSKKN